MNLNPGEVWLADLGIAAKTRPVVIVSRHDLDPPRALAIYVPLTTQYRDSLYEVVLPRLRFLDRDSIANVQGMASIPTVRLERKLGKLPDEVMLKIKQAILFALDLDTDLPDE
jgi:mRNA interferase MazF